MSKEIKGGRMSGKTLFYEEEYDLLKEVLL